MTVAALERDLAKLRRGRLVRVQSLPNIFQPDRRGEVAEVPWTMGTLEEYAPSEDWRSGEVRAIVRGRSYPRAEWRDYRPRPGDQVLYARAPDGIELLLALGVSALVATIVGTVINIGIAILITHFVAKLTGEPKRAEFGASPTYSWGGIQLTTRQGQPIPIQYGRHRVGGQLINAVPVTDQRGFLQPDKSILRLLIALGEGPMYSVAGFLEDFNSLLAEDLGSNVKIAGNPASSYPGVSASVRLGNSEQTPIPGFAENVVVTQLDFVLELDEPQEATTDGEVASFRLLFFMPNGLYHITGSGKYVPLTIFLTVRWRLAGNTIWTHFQEVQIKAGSFSAFSTSFRVDLDDDLKNNVIEVQVEKDLDGLPPQFVDDVEWDQLHSINEAQAISYPYMALLGLEIEATASLNSGIPSVTTIVEGKQVWIWDGVDPDPLTASFDYGYTTNPAWCALDLILNQRIGWGFKYSLCNVNIQSFGDWADYCDELVDDLSGTGSKIKRWEIGLRIDTQQPFMDALQQIAACGRARIIQVGNVWSVKIERPSSPVQLFAMGDIVEGSFQITYTGRRDRANKVVVQFLNEEKNYDHDAADIEDEDALAEGEETREESMSLFGVTSLARAYRCAQYLLNINRLVRTSIEFETFIDALAAEPGDVIAFQHELPKYDSVGSRLDQDAPSSTQIILDRDITVGSGETWKIFVRTIGGSGSTAFAIQERELVVSPGTITAGTTINITTAWTAGDLPQKGDVYAVGPETTVSPVRLYRIVSVSMTQDLTRRVSAIQYDEDVYDDDPGTIVEEEVDDPPDETSIPPNPTMLSLTEQVQEIEGGGFESKIFASFVKEPWPFDYQVKVFVRETGESIWSEVGLTSTSSFLIDNLDVGTTYCVSVVSVAPAGGHDAASNGTIDCITLSGKAPPPGDVQNCAAVQSGETLLITWDDLLETIKYYEVRAGYSWSVPTLVLGTPTQSQLETLLWAVGAQDLYVRARSNADRLSADPCLLEVDLEHPDTHSNPDQRDESALSWPGTLTNVVIDTVDGEDHLILDTGETSGTYESPVIDLDSGGVSILRRIGLLLLANYDEITRTWDSDAETWDSATFTWDAADDESWDGSSVAWDDTEADEQDWWGHFYAAQMGGSLGIQTRYSKDDVTYTAYQKHVPTTRDLRYVQFRLNFARDNATDYQLRARNVLTSWSDPP